MSCIKINQRFILYVNIWQRKKKWLSHRWDTTVTLHWICREHFVWWKALEIILCRVLGRKYYVVCNWWWGQLLCVPVSRLVFWATLCLTGKFQDASTSWELCWFWMLERLGFGTSYSFSSYSASLEYDVIYLDVLYIRLWCPILKWTMLHQTSSVCLVLFHLYEETELKKIHRSVGPNTCSFRYVSWSNAKLC